MRAILRDCMPVVNTAGHWCVWCVCVVCGVCGVCGVWCVWCVVCVVCGVYQTLLVVDCESSCTLWNSVAAISYSELFNQSLHFQHKCLNVFGGILSA